MNNQREAKKTKRTITLIIVSCLVLLFVGFVYDKEVNHYSMNGVVYEREENSLILLDNTDNLWKIDDTKELEIGDKIKIEFDTNGTDTERTDDIITAIIK
jgi:hypothetical protein